jgi:tetratricopeptide (TPR) repeat protein
LLSRARRVLDGAIGSDAYGARSRVATRYAFGRYLQGRYREAMYWSGIAVSEAREAGDPVSLAYSYNTRHIAYKHSGLSEEEPFGELALAAYEEIGDLRMQGQCLNNLAIDALGDGRWDVSVELFERAAGLFRRVGDTADEANSVYNRAEMLVRQGRYRDAEPLLGAALRGARTVDDQELVALVQRETGRTCAALGRWGEAIHQFDEARKGFSLLGLPQELVNLDAALAECLILTGEVENALSIVDGALEHARTLRASRLMPPLLRVRGFALLAAGQLDDARLALEEGLRAEDSTEGQHEYGRHEYALTLLGLADLLARASDPAAADIRRQGKEILEGLGIVNNPIAELVVRA